MAASSALLWNVALAAAIRGRQGDDPREVADEVALCWDLAGAEVAARREEEETTA